MVKLVFGVLGGLLLILIVLAAAALGYRAYRQNEIGGDLAIRAPNSIDETMFVEAGGIRQFITVRGEDRDNPVILFVHGGPAECHSYFPQLYRSWEKDFTIVQWDQRGAGRTYGRNAKPPADLNLVQMTQDGVAIAEWVSAHLGQSKLILVGHSWGTILGEHMVFERPDLFSAYVGTGQFVSWDSEMDWQYTYSLKRAEADRDAAKLAKLKEIGPPPFSGLEEYIAFRTATRDETPAPDLDFILKLRDMIYFAPRTMPWDALSFMRGGEAVGPLGLDLVRADLPALGLDFPVPFFVIQGAEDRTTPTDLARAYFERIQAPRKELVVIEDAGHFAAMTHPEAFLAALVEKLGPIAAGSAVQPAS